MAVSPLAAARSSNLPVTSAGWPCWFCWREVIAGARAFWPDAGAGRPDRWSRELAALWPGCQGCGHDRAWTV